MDREAKRASNNKKFKSAYKLSQPECIKKGHGIVSKT